MLILAYIIFLTYQARREWNKLANSKEKKRLLKKNMYDIICKFLFGDVELPKEFRGELYDLIDFKMGRLGTCVLWDRSSDLMEMIYRYGLPDIEKKEVCIEWNSICGSLNYKTAAFRPLTPDIK